MPITPETRERLAALMDERRRDLRLRWQDVAETAGVSLKTLHSARMGSGDISGLTKAAIENGLRWEHGSVDLILQGGEPVAGETPVVPSDDDLPPILRGLDPREIEPFLVAVDRDLTASLSGDSDPFDDFEHGILSNDEHTLDAKRVLLAIGRMYRAGVLPGQSRNRRTGLALAVPARGGAR
jgi:hypothetical protein